MDNNQNPDVHPPQVQVRRTKTVEKIITFSSHSNWTNTTNCTIKLSLSPIVGTIKVTQVNGVAPTYDNLIYALLCDKDARFMFLNYALFNHGYEKEDKVFCIETPAKEDGNSVTDVYLDATYVNQGTIYHGRSKLLHISRFKKCNELRSGQVWTVSEFYSLVRFLNHRFNLDGLGQRDYALKKRIGMWYPKAVNGTLAVNDETIVTK